jgi:hypothetical protein
MRDKSAYAKMKKQVIAMEATGHCNILKTYDHFDEEEDGTFYVVSPLKLFISFSSAASVHALTGHGVG